MGKAEKVAARPLRMETGTGNRSQLFKKLAGRARNINSAGHAALAIFHALDDAGIFAALGTCG
jgi:hypothetical protein